jgi:hypothetical protein
MDIDSEAFRQAFERFKTMMGAYSGHRFTNLNEGLAGAWENYKPKLRELALTKLDAAGWEEKAIGQGRILANAISAVEIQDNRPGGLTNNLVHWQNRFGHTSREHRALLDAQQDTGARRAIEAALFELYRANSNEGALFDRLSELTERRYTLSAYLFFLKDINRFMPIQPTGFDLAFRELNIDFRTLRNCNWDNYRRFNEILSDVSTALEKIAGLKNVRLVDAHSFCWVYRSLLLKLAEGEGSTPKKNRDDGRILGALDRSIATMRFSILATVEQSRGQVVTRNIQMKVKDLGFDSVHALDAYLAERIRIQGYQCALTGIPFHLHGAHEADKNLLPSPDRIDSAGHYAPGNIQVVCQFVNYWKRATKNDEFLTLLALVRNSNIDLMDAQ